MPMQQYEYQSRLGDLQDKYGQDEATNAYARFISQQRFKRDREMGNQTFQRGFPQAVVRMNRGMGRHIKSGVFGSNMQNHFGDFNRGMAQIDENQAADESGAALQQAQRQQAYQRALMLLQQQLASGQLGQNPFASYSSVWGN